MFVLVAVAIAALARALTPSPQSSALTGSGPSQQESGHSDPLPPINTAPPEVSETAGVTDDNPRPRKRLRRAFAFALTTLVAGAAIGLGVMRGNAEPTATSYTAIGDLSNCTIPTGTTVSEVLSLTNPNTIETTSDFTVTMPASSRQAQVVAGLMSSDTEYTAALKCLFGSLQRPAVDESKDHTSISFRVTRSFGPYLASEPQLGDRGLEMSVLGDPSRGWWPSGTPVSITVRPLHRKVLFSRTPQQRSESALTWTWITGPDPNQPAPLRVALALGTGEKVTALVSHPAQLNHSMHGFTWNLDLSIYPNYLITSLGSLLALLSLALVAARSRTRDRYPGFAMILAFLLLIMPMIVAVFLRVQVRSDGTRAAVPILGVVAVTLMVAGAALVVRSSPDRAALRYRTLIWAPVVASVIAGLISVVIIHQHWHNGTSWPNELSAAVTGLVIAAGAWSVTSLLRLMLGSLTLGMQDPRDTMRDPRDRSEEPTDSGTWFGSLQRLSDIAYTFMIGAILFAAGTATGFGLAGQVAQNIRARPPEGGDWDALSDAAGWLGGSAANPLVITVVPCAAALAVVIVTRVSRDRRLSSATVALACLAWALTARVPDLAVVGLSLPVGAWLLAGLMWALLMRNERTELEQLRWREAFEPFAGPKPRATSEPDEIGHDGLRAGPGTTMPYRVTITLRWTVFLAILPVGYLFAASLTTLPQRDINQDPVYLLYQVAIELLRWLLTGWLFGLLMPWLPGRIGPLKALWPVAAWFTASAPIAVLNIWTGNPSGREWLFPGFQLVVFLTLLAVLVDASTVYLRHRWEKTGTYPSIQSTARSLRIVYNIEGIRPVVLYTAPVVLAVIGIGQQVASGSALDFVSSILDATGPVLGGH